MTVVVTITANNQIASGYNNAGGLQPLTSISDSNGWDFYQPQGLQFFNRGLRRVGTDSVTYYTGKQSTEWLFNYMPIDAWAYLRDNYEGKVTIKTATGENSYSNYNAVLTLQSPNEMTYNDCVNVPGVYVGAAYIDVVLSFILVEAL